MFNKLFSFLLSFLGFGLDVVTVSTGTAGNAGSAAAEFVNYITAQMLDVAVLRTILDQFCQKVPLPKGAGDTVQMNWRNVRCVVVQYN